MLNGMRMIIGSEPGSIFEKKGALGALKPGGRILLCVVEHDITMSSEDPTPYGPPYSISSELVRALSDHSKFNVIQELSRQDILSSEPRWEAKGASKFMVVC